METYDQYRIKIIKDKISALKIEFLEWEVELEKITGISLQLPRPDELRKGIRADIKTCDDHLARLKQIAEELR